MRDNPRFRDAALAVAAITGEREANRFRMRRAWRGSLAALAFRPASALAIALGVHPYAPYFALRHGRRGNLIREFRRRAGAQTDAPRRV